MRNSKSLMEVHVADIASTRSRVCKTDLSVEVCTIKVNLTAVLVNDFASILNSVLKDTERRRECDLFGNY